MRPSSRSRHPRNLTPEQQQANAAVQNADGIVDTTLAALQNPSVIAHAALESLPSIHARRSVVVDSNGATFSVDDIAARRLRKEQRRKKAQQEAEAAQSGALSASTADEKPNAPLSAAAQPWTDVPPEFCCALNGSLMRQPVPSPVCSLRLRCHFLCRRLTFRGRSNQNTGTPLITPAS
jgi:hypothetical protein